MLNLERKEEGEMSVGGMKQRILFNFEGTCCRYMELLKWNALISSDKKITDIKNTIKNLKLR